MASQSDHPEVPYHRLRGSPSTPIVLGPSEIRSLLSPSSLLNHLRSSLPFHSGTVESPSRPHYPIDQSASLILMPAWSHHASLPYIGVKIVTVYPHNAALRLPSVHAAYLLFSSITGEPLASLDGTELTLWRTASVAALAAGLLARSDARVLSVVGAGGLAPHIVKAHLAAVPSLQRIVLWNRTAERARELASKLKEEGIGGVGFDCRESVEEVVEMGDIIVCATGSDSPLVKGELLKEGTHLSLIGSFSPTMRECDDEAIRRGKVFVDCEQALTEAGELVRALDRGVIQPKDVGMLVDLIRGETVGRRREEEITVFKSVGFASLDLLAAQLVYEKYLQGES